MLFLGSVYLFYLPNPSSGSLSIFGRGFAQKGHQVSLDASLEVPIRDQNQYAKNQQHKEKQPIQELAYICILLQ